MLHVFKILEKCHFRITSLADLPFVERSVSKLAFRTIVDSFVERSILKKSVSKWSGCQSTTVRHLKLSLLLVFCRE